MSTIKFTLFHINLRGLNLSRRKQTQGKTDTSAATGIHGTRGFCVLGWRRREIIEPTLGGERMRAGKGWVGVINDPSPGRGGTSFSVVS